MTPPPPLNRVKISNDPCFIRYGQNGWKIEKSVFLKIRYFDLQQKVRVKIKIKIVLLLYFLLESYISTPLQSFNISEE